MLRRANGGRSQQTFIGRHQINRKLTAPGSEKDTRHHEISLQSAPATVSAGRRARRPSARTIPPLVERIVHAVGAVGDEPVTTGSGAVMPFARPCGTSTTCTRRAADCSSSWRIAARPICARCSISANAEQLKHFLTAGMSTRCARRLERYPSVRLTAEFTETLRKVPCPRLYSIASSADRLIPDKSICSSSRSATRFAIVSRRHAARHGWRIAWPLDVDRRDVYAQNQQKHFAMPWRRYTDDHGRSRAPDLAPFRAFIEERARSRRDAAGTGCSSANSVGRATSSTRPSSWPCQGRIPQARHGVLTRPACRRSTCSTALREHARDVFWAWLEQGAEFFVCGDKDRMAADVEATLHQIVETQGTTKQAHEYIEQLRQTKRYKRDVY